MGKTTTLVSSIALFVTGLLITAPAGSAFAATSGIDGVDTTAQSGSSVAAPAGLVVADNGAPQAPTVDTQTPAPTTSATASIASHANGAVTGTRTVTAKPAGSTTTAPAVHAPAGPSAKPVTPAKTVPAGPSYGIDVSTSQAGMNFKEAAKQGAKFAIVKMGGDNVAPEYVAPDYATQVNQARAAGMDIGHYYIPGKGQTPAQQADYMASHLHNFNKSHDVLALDDEVLDSNGMFFNDAQASQFFTELIKDTGVPANHVWLYVDASNAHTHGPWTGVKNLGVKVWWAQYGNEPTGHVPTSQPELRGSFPKWDIQQFTDKSKIAGQTVDGDYTNEALSQLF